MDAVVYYYDIQRPLKNKTYKFVFNESSKRNLSELDILFTNNLN